MPSCAPWSPALPAGAGETILLLMTALLAASGPRARQRATILGIELLVLAAVVLTWTVTIQVHAGGGLYWVVPGVILLLVVAVANAWVLLTEIDR